MRTRLWSFLSLPVLLTACTHENPSSSSSSETSADNNAPPPGVFAVPQEELARTPDAVKLKGTITVKDYTTGLLQIDATLPVDGSTVTPQGTPPITVARYKTPGPYELLLPPKTTAINLSLILDIQGNGPDAGDPRLTYAGNPVAISGNEVTGVDLSIENSPTALPPADPAADGTAAGTGTADVVGTGTGSGTAPDALSSTGGTAVSTGSSPTTPSGSSSTSGTGSAGAAGSGTAGTGVTAATSATQSTSGAGPTPDPLDPSLDKGHH